MKQLIDLVLLGLLCSNAVLADVKESIGAQSNGLQGNDSVEIEAKEAAQSGRIVNGFGANIERYRFVISLRFQGEFYCGASIISPSHALTAGHCVYWNRFAPYVYNLYGGSTSATSGGASFQVLRIALHPSFDPSTFPGTPDFDVAVLTAPTNSFQGQTNMVPIALQTSEMRIGTLCQVVGWGRTSANAPAPANKLRYANMHIVSQATCKSKWAAFQAQPVTSNMICARNCLGVDVCGGDNGNPLICNGMLTGLVSFSNADCKGARPTGFAKLTAPSIRSFIRDQTGI